MRDVQDDIANKVLFELGLTGLHPRKDDLIAALKYHLKGFLTKYST